MKTRDLLSKVMNMATNNPAILDMDVEFPCDGGCGTLPVYYIYIEDGKLMLDC